MTEINKSGWPRGPWDVEPDQASFVHAGLSCEIRRHHWSGHLCGYVHIPEGHPWRGIDSCDDRSLDDAHKLVHGGLTFADGERIGFDCAHYGDMCPGDQGLTIGGEYRNLEYVKGITKRLAEHVASRGGEP